MPLNADFAWEYPACHRLYGQPQRAADCPCPNKKSPATIVAPLVRCPDLAMFDGHPLALTGWLEAEQAVISLRRCKSTKVDANSPKWVQLTQRPAAVFATSIFSVDAKRGSSPVECIG
jgi:hypothetical protein